MYLKENVMKKIIRSIFNWIFKSELDKLKLEISKAETISKKSWKQYETFEKILSGIDVSEYKKNKVPRADWNAYPENPNARPWYRFGFSAPTIDVVKKWVEDKTGIIVNTEEEIKKALENF